MRPISKPCRLPVLALFVSAAPAFGQLVFTEQADEMGVLNAYTPISEINSLPQFMFGGGAAADFDRDGDQDIFALGGLGGVDKLFVNNGDGTFTERAAAWGVDRSHRGVGASVADADNDGDLDLFVTSYGASELELLRDTHILYLNNGPDINGQWSFTDVALEAGVRASSPFRPDGFGSCWGDYDLDGDLDMLVAGWNDIDDGERLFRNDGVTDGVPRFTDVTDEATPLRNFAVYGFTPGFLDMDGDGYPEILLASDFSTTTYLRNNGDGTFTDLTGVADARRVDNGMGATIADFNDDGLPDWFVTAIETVGGNALYINRENHTYDELSQFSQTTDGGWGWGAQAGDYDNDGDLDIFETNGWSLWERPYYLYLNQGSDEMGRPSFLERGAQAGVDMIRNGRSVAALDFDNDGDLDVAGFNHREELDLFVNDLPKEDSGFFLRVLMDNCGRDGITPDGIGAKLTVTSGGRTQTRWLTGMPSYLATSELVAHIGLGSDPVVDELRVEWPGGHTRVLVDLPANEAITVTANRADIAPPLGELNVEDFIIFLTAFSAQTPDADLAAPAGVFDFNDALVFLSEYARGCR